MIDFLKMQKSGSLPAKSS